MSDWQLSNKPPQEYVDDLYGSDGSVYEEEEDIVDDGDLNEEWSDGENRVDLEQGEFITPGYSPLASPQRRQTSVSPPRSRSPLDRREGNASLHSPMPESDQGGAMDVDPQQLFVADAHALSDPRAVRERSQAPACRARRGRGSARSSRKTGRRTGGVASNTGTRWQNGMPLQEIYLSDDEVPPELMALARGVMRAREEREEVRRAEFDEDGEEQLFDAAEAAALEDEKFEWHSMNSFQGTEEPFTVERTGSVESHSTAYDAFRAYWSDDFLQEIVDQTNHYASRITSLAFQRDWFQTNVHELLCLFAFWIMLGIIRMPTVKSCFSKDGIMRTEVFRSIFNRERYANLVRALHFADEEDQAVREDCLGPIRPIVTTLNEVFQQNYILSQRISLDESLTLWKGRSDIKQYLPLKAAKFGIKTLEVCESTTGYLWAFIVYTGKPKSLDISNKAFVLKSTAIVQALLRPLLHKGYQVFMDNWYNSPALARWLKRRQTDCVGTLRTSRTHVPKLLEIAPLKRGQLIARHSGDVSVLSWQDKKRVNMISTYHGSATAMSTVQSKPNSSWPVQHKPQVVLDYNKFMRGVDLKDQMLEPYLLERKRGPKWYIKLFKRLLTVSILNARILLESSTQSKQDHLQFRLSLVRCILDQHLPFSSSTRSTPHPYSCPVESMHWLVLLPDAAGRNGRNRLARRRCIVCCREKRNTTTPYMCEACNIPLCVLCMKSFHTTTAGLKNSVYF